MGINKDIEKEVKKEGFIKRNAKKSGKYVKEEGKKFTNAKDIIYYSSFIKKIIMSLNPFKEREKAREETFDNAVKRLKLDEKQLKENFNYYRFYFFIGLIMLVSSVLFGGYLMLIKGNYWALGPTIACIAIGLAQMFNGSFRTYQINNRVLCSVSSWKNAGYYFPLKFTNNESFEVIKRKEKNESLKRLMK